jgi:hypothetical protein
MPLAFFSTSACSRRASNTAAKISVYLCVCNLRFKKISLLLKLEYPESLRRDWTVERLRKIRCCLVGGCGFEEGRTRWEIA